MHDLLPQLQIGGSGWGPGRRSLSSRWKAFSAGEAELAAAWRAPDLTADSLALLQYTSGPTAAGLSGSGITCPPLDPGLLRTYLRYFAEVVFLNAPS